MQSFRYLPVVLLLILLTVGYTSVSAQTTHTVACEDVPGLISAINSAASGDTISLATECSYELMTVDNTVVGGNSDGPNGLPVIDKTLIIDGNGATIERSSDEGTPGFRILFVTSTGDLTLDQITIANGLAGFGGGITNDDGGLTITDSIITGNRAINGGGISGLATISDSLIVSNQADDFGGGFSGSGSIVNSTITGNNATFGGGIESTATLTIMDSTISGNSADDSGGGMATIEWLDGPGSSIELKNTIVAGNSAPGAPDILGTVNSQGYNLIGNTAGITMNGTTITNITEVSPLLNPLADNGGLIQTMALRSGSPAIDTGSCSSATDQRGIARPVDFGQIANVDSGCDIGAFELQTLSFVANGESYVLDHGQSLNGNVLDNDFDPGINPLSATLDTGPSHAQSFTLNPDGTFDYTPTDGWYGTDTFTYTTDSTVGPDTDTATATVIVGPDFSIPCSNDTQLIDAFEHANISAGPDTIHLATDCVYTLTEVNHTLNMEGFNDNGLPVVGGDLTIEGNGATIERDDSGGIPEFRILFIGVAADNVTLNNLTIAKGYSTYEYGYGIGIIHFGGTLTIRNSTVTGNTSGLVEKNGAIFSLNGVLIVEDSIISQNSAGGIWNDNDCGNGPPPACPPSSLSVTRSVISDNEYGIINTNSLVTVTESIIADNWAYGIGSLSWNEEITVIGSTISGNGQVSSGGGITTHSNDGELTIVDSTISNNLTDRHGGGISNSGNRVTITSSTITGNSATGTGIGAGIYIGSSDAPVVITGSTISGNSAGNNGGGIYVDNHPNVHIGASIVAGNTAATGPDIFGEIISDDYNLIQDTTDAIITGVTANNIYEQDPLLGPLQDNGGPTWTMALLEGSPAIDAGGACGLATDQRGALRNIPCDIGAYEVPVYVTISEEALFGAMEAQIAANPAIQEIDFVLADFVPGLITLTVRTTDGTVGDVMISIEEAAGYAVLQVDRMSVEGGAAPASYVDAINAEMLALLVGSLDALIEQQMGAGRDLAGISLTDTAIMLEIAP